jgi:hypothetical protein
VKSWSSYTLGLLEVTGTAAGQHMESAGLQGRVVLRVMQNRE